MLKRRILNLLASQRQEMLSDLSATLQREREATQTASHARDAAFQQALQVQQHQFHLELEALRAELQAERAMFQTALQELRHGNGIHGGDGTTQSIERLANTIDAALVTLVLNTASGVSVPGASQIQ